MKVIKNNMRYEILEKQFFYSKISRTIEESNQRIFTYVYNYTDIYYLEDLEVSTLYDYIHYSVSNNNISLLVHIKDIKNFLFYLEKIVHMVDIPKVDLSLTNISLWGDIGNHQLCRKWQTTRLIDS